MVEMGPNCAKHLIYLIELDLADHNVFVTGAYFWSMRSTAVLNVPQ